MAVRAKRAEKLLNPNQPTETLGLIFIQQVAHDLRRHLAANAQR